MKLKIQYFAHLREQRGCSEEELESDAQTPEQLYQELKSLHHFKLDLKDLKVAKDDHFCNWQDSLQEGDTITFLPPVGGG